MDKLQWTVKVFEELTTRELYALIKSRIDVFVVEQACAYPETDDKDQRAVHLYVEKAGTIVAYARLLPPGLSYPQASIGRVLVHQDHRGKGYGRQLLEKSLEIITQEWQEGQIKISAQSHLQNFYQYFGFRQISAPYLDDGIQHIDMLLQTNR